MNNQVIIRHLNQGGNAGNHRSCNASPKPLSSALFKSPRFAIVGITNASFLPIGLLVSALLVFFIYNPSAEPEGLSKTSVAGQKGAAQQKKGQSAKENQPVHNPRKDLAELEQQARQAIATAQAALAAMPVSAPNLDATRTSTMDAPSSDSQSQVTNQLSDQLADNPPLAPQRQAKIDQLHSKLQQLQTQQAKQQQLRHDKQDSLSRYGLE